LLISVSASDAEGLMGRLVGAGVSSVEVGEVVEKQKPLIAVCA